MGKITVSKLPKDPGPAAWNALLPPAPPPQPLEENISADWLVVGGGFTGLAAARRLSQLCEGDRIVLLDACRLAEGPAGRNSGFMIDLPHDLASEDYGGALETDRTQIRLNRSAIAFAEEAAREYGMAAEAFQKVGKINAAASEKGLKHTQDYAGHLAKLGEEHRFLDAGDMRALSGSSYYQGGLFTPGTAMLQPALFVRSLGAGLAPVVTVHENSPVTALERKGTAWRATTPSGSVSAGRVILAVNGHVESFGFYPRRLMHIFLYGSMTRPLSDAEMATLGGEPTWGFTPADPMGTTLRKISGTGGTRIVVRNRATFDPGLEIPEPRIARMGQTHDKCFAARFPNLGDVEMEYRWGGRLCLSRNSVAAFGELEQGLYSACCQNGLGAARGTLSGMLSAELAAGQPSEFVDLLLAEDQPTKLPPEPLASIGAAAVMRWGEYKAGAEL
ncbi:MAG: FAD-binding oxidoreductase [Pseudomonadota bacterium]